MAGERPRSEIERKVRRLEVEIVRLRAEKRRIQADMIRRVGKYKALEARYLALVKERGGNERDH